MNNNDSSYFYNEHDKGYSTVSSYSNMNNTQILLDENEKEISDFSSYNSHPRGENKNIKDELQSELDYLSNLNSTLSSTSKPFNSGKGKSKVYRKKDNQSSVSSKSSYTESITESIPNTNSKEDYYSYDSKDHPKDDISFTSFNNQLNNACNELEHKLIKVCSGILSNVNDEIDYKDNIN
ncbi:hypothetical protein PIROE2DRAFT_18656, partial [Piromyces sp. E2]